MTLEGRESCRDTNSAGSVANSKPTTGVSGVTPAKSGTGKFPEDSTLSAKSYGGPSIAGSTGVASGATGKGGTLKSGSPLLSCLTVTALPRDVRGEIAQVEFWGQKFNMLYSKKGSLRGGDLHPVTQFGFIIDGCVRVHRNEFPPVWLYSNGHFITIEPGVAHLYEYLADTVMLEWWDGPFSAEYYPPFREIVEECLRGGKQP